MPSFIQPPGNFLKQRPAERAGLQAGRMSEGAGVREQEGGTDGWTEVYSSVSHSLVVFSLCLPCSVPQHELQAETSACEFFSRSVFSVTLSPSLLSPFPLHIYPPCLPPPPPQPPCLYLSVAPQVSNQSMSPSC